jgi:hypothetical protein
MEHSFTYQLDSLRQLNPLNLAEPSEPGGLRIERTAPLPIEPLPARRKESETALQEIVQPRSSAQSGYYIREMWRQRENNLLIGNSRYIEPRHEILFTSSLSQNSLDLRLPERPRNEINYDWLTLLLLISLALFASVRNSWDKYLGNLFQSVFNYSTSYRMYQEKNSSVLQGAFQLDIFFYLVASVFAFQVMNFYRIESPYHNFLMYLASLGMVFGYFSLKKTIYQILGRMIEKNTETGEYLFNTDNFKRVAGLILFPMVAVIAFYPYGNLKVPVITGILIVFFLYFLLVLRGFIILLRKQFSIFYLFLYFCTLEILPLVLLYKILVV